MTDSQPTQPEQQSPPGPAEAQWAPPESTSSELWVSWLVIVAFILFSLVGLIWVIVDAPRLGYRRHDALFVLIPIYGPYVFRPKMAWRIGHRDRTYWQNWPAPGSSRRPRLAAGPGGVHPTTRPRVISRLPRTAPRP